MAREAVGGVRDEAHGLKHGLRDQRLEDVEFEMPLALAKATTAPLPIVCAQTMQSASTWVGLTLPGMIEEPGSFSGKRDSPSPVRGPEPSRRMSLAILKSAEASEVRAPCVNASASCAAIAWSLLGAETKGSCVSSAILPANSSANCGCVLSPVPTAVAPRQARAGRPSSPRRGPAPVRPAPRNPRIPVRADRRGVLQMGAAGLDHIRECDALFRQRLLQARERGQQRVRQFFDHGDMHGGGKGIVRRLARLT